MKKYLLIGIPLVIVLLLAVFGSDLLGLYRLQGHITTSTAAYLADGGPWPHVTDTCTVCHGVKGNSLHQGYPSLAGQPAPYLETQLHNFASEARRNPNMGPLAMTMSDPQIKSLAEYFAGATPVANRYFKPDQQLREKGQHLVAAGNCVACHGSQLMGHEQFPRLAGQGYDYLLAQFDEFASGTRSEPTGVMKSLSQGFSSEDRKAIASYLASLDPKKD
ncbi:c-type cytochrome [Paraburkholderia sp. BL10I2N1]|uniref:c-type cytochrome n=1 Tax=Paraburkholderia sp. BL10I2N1 TaxID=1938796 RepID=UPI00105CB766|nr:c-type cytochrome [Paraburkholderia sp. BL10I2N1]TDN69484.1 cytochrome c553 [Paraburkholderia sp. BL10I2N1]